jgi:hypothetical protein
MPGLFTGSLRVKRKAATTFCKHSLAFPLAGLLMWTDEEPRQVQV